MATPAQATGLDEFLKPLSVDLDKIHTLSDLFLRNFQDLCANSAEQFLPTPISESILRPTGERGHGRYLAIDIGGTNLRVGFVELYGDSSSIQNSTQNGSIPNGTSLIQRRLESSWPIDEHLKNDNADSLFRWIGNCIAQVVRKGCQEFDLPKDRPLPLGITFSFPMEQRSLREATLMPMGKGFAVSSKVDLGSRLLEGYSQVQTAELPSIQIAAIANDSVSTLMSFIFNYDENEHRKATMGLILGTGSNATIPLKLNLLKATKRPQNVNLLPGEKVDDAKMTVNTELSINGTAPPMRELGMISRWDALVDAQNEKPGFQPLEYMTAGRYLGELGRLMLMDYMTTVLGISEASVPSGIRKRYGLSTTFLSHFKPPNFSKLLELVRAEFPESSSQGSFLWTEELAEALYRIAKAIEVRAAGIIAAAILALLTLAKELPSDSGGETAAEKRELGVGYTGGCIVHFQDYLADCQDFIDRLMDKRYCEGSKLRVVLSPCHDGGITGAGILAAAATSSKEAAV